LLPTDAHTGAVPEVSVILVNWNTADLAIAAITSLKRHETSVRLELIVVDNASAEDDGGRILREHPDVRLLRSERNLGFAGGNNLGARAAAGEFLLLLNTDTLFTEEVLPACLAVARAQAPAIIGCRLHNADGSLQVSAERFPTVGRVLRDAFASTRSAMEVRMRGLEGAHTRPVDWICGAFLLVPRAAYRELGGLSEAIFMYGEDTEFCWRARAADIATWYVPGVSIIHFGGGGLRHGSLRSVAVSDAGRIRSFAMMRGRGAAFGLRMALLLRSLLRCCAFGAAGLLRRNARRHAWVHARAAMLLIGAGRLEA